MLYTDWFYAIAPHHPVKMAVMIFFMEKYLKELSIFLLLLFFSCSAETNISNFEDIFVKDIQVTCSLIALNPSDLNAIRIRGDAYYELKKNEKAIADYSVLIDSGKEDHELFLKRGIALHAMGQYDRALADIDKSIELNPKNAWGYHRRADLLSALEKYDEALKNFSIVIGMIPTDPAAYTCRGRLYKKQKENEKALEEFNKAIEINPNHFYSLYQRGLYYINRKQYKKAIEDLELVIDIDPPYLSYKYKKSAFIAMSYAHFGLKEYFNTVSDFVGVWHMRQRLNSLNKKINAAEKIS